MTRTVEALVSAARQEAGLNRATSDVRDGIAAAGAGVRDEAVAKGTEIGVDVPPTRVGVAIEADLVERIIHPLLDNAVRYGRTQVSIVLEANGASATIHVNDDGVGVAESERELIFDPGVRGRAGADAPSGVGLGLALARRLARTVGGEIVAAPDPHGGRFSVRLPLA